MEEDVSGSELPPELDVFLYPERTAIYTYWERAASAFSMANQSNDNPKARAFFIATCSHNCRTLLEVLRREQKVRVDAGTSPEGKYPSLMGADLIKQVADHDLHGIPVPICDPNAVMFSKFSSKKEMTLTSSHGVAVQTQWGPTGMQAKYFPKDLKHGKFKPGDGLEYMCSKGELYVAWRGKNIHLGTELGKFLRSAQRFIVHLYP